MDAGARDADRYRPSPTAAGQEDTVEDTVEDSPARSGAQHPREARHPGSAPDGERVQDPATASDLLAERYGRTRTPVQRRRTTVLVAVAAAVVGLVAVVWLAIGQARVPVRTADVGFAIIDASAVDVTFDVIKDPAATATCRVRALSPSFAEIGVRDVVVGPSSGPAVRVTVRVATTELATTGMVQRCDVADAP